MFDKSFLNWRKAVALAKKYTGCLYDEELQLVIVSGRKLWLKDFDIKIDLDSTRKYYERYTIPEWFQPYIKMRHFRALQTCGKWEFLERRLNNNGFPHDKAATWKAYYSMNRMLDSKAEKEGRGHPIGLSLCVLDIDGKHKGLHELNDKGECLKCRSEALKKLGRLHTKTSAMAGIQIVKVLRSGIKGFHVYFTYHQAMEIPTKQFEKLINTINKEGKIVDEFFNKSGWDLHRIMKLPGSVDASNGVIVSEENRRINFHDVVITKQEKV